MAVAVLREAGEAAAPLAPGSAARWFTAALRLVSDDAPAEERVELLLALARVLAASGSFAESLSPDHKRRRSYPRSPPPCARS